MSLVLRQDIGRRLTIEEMDGNFTYLEGISGGGGVIPLSFTQATDLMLNSNIVAGQYYIIKDTSNILYGSNSEFEFGEGTDIILTGLDNSNFSKNGWGKFYNPIYYNNETEYGFYIWDYTGNTTYATNSIAIYGGQAWENLNSNIGTASDYFTLNNEDWQLLSYTNSNYYTITWDEIEFDFTLDEEFFSDTNGYITSRYDGVNNNLVKIDVCSNLFWCEVTPIQMFRWGHRLEDGGVANCTVNESYFGCLNYVYGQINGINVSNFSSIFDFQMINASSFFNSNISNGGNISSVVLDGSILADINITNSYYEIYSINISGIYNCNFLGSSIYQINLSNGSSIFNFDTNNSSLYNIVLNGSVMSNDSETLSLDSSNMHDIKLINNSNITNVYFSSATVYDIDLSNSSYISNIQSLGSINDISLDNSHINAINIEDSNSFFTNIALSNSSYIECGEGGLYLNDNSGIEYLDLSNNSYIECGEGGFNLYNSFLFNIDFSNNSYLDAKVIMTSSTINDLKLNNNSSLRSGYSGENNIISLNDSASLSQLNIDNNSILADIILDNSSITYTNISNSSIICDSILFDNSTIGYFQISDSSIGSNLLTNSDISDVQMYDSVLYNMVMANSDIANVIMSDSSIGDSTITMDNSSITDITMYDSVIYDGSMSDNSLISEILIKGSQINNFNFNRGSFYSIDIFSSYINSITFSNNKSISFTSFNSSVLSNTILSEGSIEFMYLKDARFINFIGTNYNLYHIDMTGSLFDFGSTYSDIPNYTEFKTNTLKYKFSITFDGTSGNGDIGQINIGKYLAPTASFYIEKVIIDSSNLIANSTSSTINVGISDNTYSGLSASNLGSNFVLVSDISNGGASGAKTTDIDYLNASIVGDAINSGTLYLEVTLKNTNYGYNNEIDD